MSDPIKIKNTTCLNGHVVFLGNVYDTKHGTHRQAFNTSKERTEAKKEAKHRNFMVAAMFGGFRL